MHGPSNSEFRQTIPRNKYFGRYTNILLYEVDHGIRFLRCGGQRHIEPSLISCTRK